MINPLLDKFSDETGILVYLIIVETDKLLTQMIRERPDSTADLLITVDAGRFCRTVQSDVFSGISFSPWFLNFSLDIVRIF